MTFVGILCELQINKQQNSRMGYLFFFPNYFFFLRSGTQVTRQGHSLEYK